MAGSRPACLKRLVHEIKSPAIRQGITEQSVQSVERFLRRLLQGCCQVEGKRRRIEVVLQKFWRKLKPRESGHARPGGPILIGPASSETMIDDIQQFHCLLLIAINSSML